MQLGSQMKKSEFNSTKYMQMAQWCNSQQYRTIEDKGDYYEIVDCTPTQEELNAAEKQQLLQQVKTVNEQIAELDVAVMCDNGDDTTDIIVDGNVLTMTSDELDAYHTGVMNLRSDILNRIKELK